MRCHILGSLSLFLAGEQSLPIPSTHSFTTMSSRVSSSITSDDTIDPDESFITVLGFGSLLSERSSRVTFPDLQNFRLGRLPNFRRVYAHPAHVFFRLGVADLPTLQMSSLSVEPCPGQDCLVSVFEVPNQEMMQDGVPSRAFLEREEEFDIVSVPYLELDKESLQYSADPQMGIVCQRSTDQAYVERWGKERF